MNALDIGTLELHDMAKVDQLYKRRMLQLLCIMYDLRQGSMYKRDSNFATRAGDRYIFEISRANLELYSKSPYCTGAKFWNDLPKQYQDLRTKELYKHAIKDLV